MNRNFIGLFVSFILAVSMSVFAQKSVEVPDYIEEKMSEFQLSIDHLNQLEDNIESNISTYLNQLSEIRSEIGSLPKGSRKRSLAINRYRGVLSEYFASSYGLLDEMDGVRNRAISQMTTILSGIKEKESPAFRDLRRQMQEVHERTVKLECKQVILSTILKYGDLSEADASQMNTEWIRSRYDQKALSILETRLAQLRNHYERMPGTSMSGLKNHLRNILAQLKTGLVWIDSQKIFIRQLVALDRERMDFNKALENIAEMIEQFTSLANRFNRGKKIREQVNVELFDQGGLNILTEVMMIPDKIPIIEPFEESSSYEKKAVLASDLDAVLEKASRKSVKENQE